jgi:putative spermidine/putrescine transport system substrate-binding protein
MNFLKTAIASIAALATTAGIGMAQDLKTEIGPGEGQVDIVAWPGYIERGETDKN